MVNYERVYVIDPETRHEQVLDVKEFLRIFDGSNQQERTGITQVVQYWLGESQRHANLYRTLLTLRRITSPDIITTEVGGRQLTPEESIREERENLNKWQDSVVKLSQLYSYLQKQT